MIFMRESFCLSAASLSRQRDILDFSWCPLSRVLHVTSSLALVMQNVNFIMSQFPEFPNQSRWKEYPRENNTRATKVWVNVAQTRLSGEFWACDVSAHKTNLDLSFICGHHHLHLVDYRPINRSLHYLLHRADQTQQGNSWLSVGTLSCRCPVKLFT